MKIGIARNFSALRRSGNHTIKKDDFRVMKYKTIDPSFVTEINSLPSFFPNRRFWLPIEAAIRPVESLNHQPESSREAV